MVSPLGDRVESAAQIDEDGWRRLHQELLNDLPRRTCWAPHIEAIHRHAFAAVRTRLLDKVRHDAVAPGPYFVPKSNARGPAATQRRHCLLDPVQEAQWLLLAATAIARAEPTLDRRRLHSSRPAGASETGLFSPPEEWTRSYSAAVEQALAGAGAVARLDVARCGERIDRDRLYVALETAAPGPSWLAVARQLFQACAGSLGPVGLPISGFVTAGFVSVALLPLDRWCARHALASARMMDDTLIAAPDLNRARRLADGAREVLAGIGLEERPDSAIVQTKAEYLAERARAHARMPDAGWSRDGVRDLLAATAEDDPRFLPIFDAGLARLATARDAVLLPHILQRFPHLPAAARTFAIHLSHFIDDPAVADRAAAMLARHARQLHPWQWCWALSAFRRAPRLRSGFLDALSGLLADETVPETVRIAAAGIRTRFATRADWAELERQADAMRSPHVRAALAWGLVHRPAAERRPVLRAWAARDPLVALVAEAVEAISGPGNPAPV